MTTVTEIHDLADNEYVDLAGNVVKFEDGEWLENIEWVEDGEIWSRYLFDGNSIWLNENFEEVER